MKPYNIILVFPMQKIEQMETVSLELCQGLQREGQEPHFDRVLNETEALQRCKDSPEHYDLLITSPDIPEDRKLPLRSEEKRGIELIKSVRKNKIRTPCVLLAEYTDDEIETLIEKCDLCRTVLTGTGDWEGDLKIQCLALLLEKAERDKHQEEPTEKVAKATPRAKEREDGRVDIILITDPDPHFEYSAEGKNFHIEVKNLHCDRRKFTDLRNRSDNISELRNWQNELHAIGYELRCQLSLDSEFDADMAKVVSCCGGPENVRIRFVVDRNIHPIAVEALLDSSKKDYCMLYSPIYRTIRIDMFKPPLFMDSQTKGNPINCLIIEANTSGVILDVNDDQGRRLELEPLVNVQKESQEMKKYLNRNKGKFNIGKVGHVVQSSKKQSYFDRMANTLTERGPWHLVHFAGHSYYDKAEDAGYVFIPGPTGPKAIPAEGFAMYLRQADTRFVYLSSCKSGGADFVYELAKKQIPSILGFRWDIEDAEAAEHAQLFYKTIFNKAKSLPYAFFETRREMYSRHSDNRIWCAAMLVIQNKV